MEFDCTMGQQIVHFNLDEMKALKHLTSLIALIIILLALQVNAQNVGTAADKQKQANLEKNKKHQAERMKKYYSLTPEQAAEAKQRASEKKLNGGKKQPGGSNTSTGAVTKTQEPSAVVSKSNEQPPKGNIKKSTGSGKPVWMDEKGKTRKKTSAVTTQVGKAEKNPSTPGKVVGAETKKKNTIPKTTVKKAAPIEKSKAAVKKK
jgi:hypothetical protein